MELLLNNLIAGKVRDAQFGGRDYKVAPATLIVPGVLPGSKGPLYYPHDEVSKDPAMWNGMPLVVNHPMESGVPASARSPKILEKYGIGYVFNAEFNSKLTAELWFDVEHTKRIEPRILDWLQAGKPFELSTGLFTRNDPRQGVFNGRKYSHIARNYRPDHLAILPDDSGACSRKDGCGVLVNKSDEPVCNLVEGVCLNCGGEGSGKPGPCPGGGGGGLKAKKKAAYEATHDAAKASKEVDGWDTKSTSFSSQSARLHNNIQEVVKQPGKTVSEAGHEALAKAHDRLAESHYVKMNAHMKDATVGEDFGPGGQTVSEKHESAALAHRRAANAHRAVHAKPTTNSGDQAMKDKLIEWLTTNCSCWKGENDAETLNELSEEKLKALKDAAVKSKEAEAVVNAAREGFGFGEEITTNALPAAIKKKAKACDDEDSVIEPPAVMNMEQWEASMPPEAKAVWNSAKQVANREKKQVINALTKHISDPAKRKLAVNKLKDKTLEDLAERLELMPAPVVNQDSDEDDSDDDEPIVNYSGSGVIANRRKPKMSDEDRGDFLEVATLNFGKDDDGDE